MSEPSKMVGYVDDSAVLTIDGFSTGVDYLLEHIPALLHPESVRVFAQMRHDPMIAGILKAYGGPINRASWSLDPAGCRDEVAVKIADDLGLPIKGWSDEPNQDEPDLKVQAPTGARRRNFTWGKHLRLAGMYRAFGHMFFEQQWTENNGWSLNMVQERMPQTIAALKLNNDGTLNAVAQGSIVGHDTILITTADHRLVHYVREREGSNYFGQALPLDTPIPSPDGWTTMGELREGSRLFDENGRICHVRAVSEVWRDRRCYDVKLSDGGSLIADENHQWSSHQFMDRTYRNAEPTIVTTAELAESLTVRYGGLDRRNHALVKPGPLQYVKQDLLIPPYVLGAWLGDGSKHNGQITSASWDAPYMSALIEENGYATKTRHNGAAGGNGRNITILGDFMPAIRALGLRLNKHIPDGYLRGSVDQRLALLQGLMDTDGSSTNGACEFVNTNRDLIDGVAELVRSLGAHAAIHARKTPRGPQMMPSGQVTEVFKQAWRVTFTPPFTPFRLPRKVEKFEAGNQRHRGTDRGRDLGPRKWRYVQSVTEVERRDTVCIEVDSPSHLFLAGRELVPTHNSLIRPCYAPWLIKTQVMRVWPTSNRRNGMGIWEVQAPPNATPNQILEAQRIASTTRASESAGIGLPPGFTAALKGMTGTLPNHAELAAFCDQQMARACLTLLLTMAGAERGNRSLGETVMDLLIMAQQDDAEFLAAEATSQLVVPLVDANFGENEPAPQICVGQVGADVETTAQDIYWLTAYAGLKPDRPAREWIRQQRGMPPEDPDDPIYATAPDGAPVDPSTDPNAPSGGTQ